MFNILKPIEDARLGRFEVTVQTNAANESLHRIFEDRWRYDSHCLCSQKMRQLKLMSNFDEAIAPNENAARF